MYTRIKFNKKWVDKSKHKIQKVETIEEFLRRGGKIEACPAVLNPDEIEYIWSYYGQENRQAL